MRYRAHPRSRSEPADGVPVTMPAFLRPPVAPHWVAGLLLAAAPLCPAGPAAPQPTLVLAISVDQYSANLYEDWRPRYAQGLARLSRGIVYSSGFQTHAITDTCPGHSVLLTGKHPNHTGIVDNELTAPDGSTFYCVTDTSVSLAHDPKARPVGPANLMTSTLGEWLKAHSPTSRVVAISGKDRAAITLSGHHPDAVFWIAPGYGFTTYIAPGADAAQALAPLAALNARLRGTWEHPPAWTYRHAACRRFEEHWEFNGLGWDSRLPPQGWSDTRVASTPAERKQAAAHVVGSPLLDEMTAQGARELIRRFDLGKGPAVDLLAVSFSGTDYVGHRFGTRGPEMCEQQYRLDAAIGGLLAELDQRHVHYLVMLSADHGGSDFPERLARHGYPAATRVADEELLGRVNRSLMQELGLTEPPLTGSIDEQTVHIAAADRDRVRQAAVRLLRAQPEVAAVFTREELLATPALEHGIAPEEVSLQQRFALSVYPGRSPDLLIALQPLDYPLDRPKSPGTDYLATHGSPWDYDRRVPILFWWPGIAGETRYLPVETVSIAPTLAALIGVPAPQDLDGDCLPLGPGAAPCPPGPRDLR